MSTPYPFLYDAQIRTHIGQFMRVFRGFQYDTRKKDADENPITEPVRVVLSSMDKITADILNDRKDRPNVELPIMGVDLVGLSLADDEPHAFTHMDTVASTDKDSARVAYSKLVGPSYVLSLSVTVYTSNMSQLLSLLEQIMLVFNNTVSVRVSNEGIQADRHSAVRLMSIDNSIGKIESGSKRIMSQTLTFEMPLKLRYPVITDNKFIDTIVKRNVLVDDIEEVTDDMLDDDVSTIDGSGIS